MAIVGLSWAPLGAIMGSLGAILGPFWAIWGDLGRAEGEIVEMSTSIRYKKKRRFLGSRRLHRSAKLGPRCGQIAVYGRA